MEIITKDQLLKMYDYEELSDDEMENIYGGVSELEICLDKCITENKDENQELQRLRTMGCWAKKCFLSDI